MPDEPELVATDCRHEHPPRNGSSGSTPSDPAARVPAGILRPSDARLASSLLLRPDSAALACALNALLLVGGGPEEPPLPSIAGAACCSRGHSSN